MSYCKVQMIGNLTRDPEVRQVGSNGTSVVNVGIATNKRIKKGDKYVEQAAFHDLTIWGKQAEIFARYLSKGSQVFVEGGLEYSEWEDKESGQKRRKAIVNVRDFTMLGNKGEAKQESAPDTTPSIPDDDVPF